MENKRHHPFEQMKKKIPILILTFQFTVQALLLAANNNDTNRITAIIDSIENTFAPDKRIAVFDIEYRMGSENTVILSGVTDLPPARDALENSLKAFGLNVDNGIRLLPDFEETGENNWGIVNVSVCNLRTYADYDAGQSSQAILGMPVRIIQKAGWWQVQTPDKYLAWVLPASIHAVTRQKLSEWNKSKQIVATDIYGFVYSKANKKSQIISDIVAGNRLKWIGTKGKFYQVAYPDGRQGFIPKEASRPLDKWRSSLKQDAENILATGLCLNGIPYMWGGTSTKGVDCSGFVRTTLLMHDIIIPRDASQQAYKGKRIEINSDFSNLEPGDLLFFGKKASSGRKERVSHVGIYMGNKKFIHSLGWVHVSSFDPSADNYDEYDLNRLLFASRVLPYINKENGLNTTDKNEFYQ